MIHSRNELMSFLEYQSGTGKFIWIRRPANRCRIGAAAGYIHRHGYIEIEFRGRVYQAHRLAWLFVYGCWPKYEVDHINGVRNDNRINNLRDATKSQNQHNRKRWSKKTSSRHKGVCFHKATGKWVADIQCNHKRVHLGLFVSEEDAAKAYKLAAIKLHGEFARV